MNFPGSFRFLGNWDYKPLYEWVSSVPDDAWNVDTYRSNRFKVHESTRTLPLVFDHDFRLTNVTYHPLYDELSELVAPLIELTRMNLGHHGYLVRLVLVSLKGGCSISPHVDQGDAFLFSHRVHAPVISHDEVIFTVNNEQKNLKAGEAWEINNISEHSVVNSGSMDRVHLILDWTTLDLLQRYLQDVVTSKHIINE